MNDVMRLLYLEELIDNKTFVNYSYAGMMFLNAESA